MDKQAHQPCNDTGTLAEDARAFMAATADVAGEKLGEARKRLAAALERGQEIRDRVREQVAEGAKAKNDAVREHPYQAVSIAFGAGALIGYLLSRRGSRRNDYIG